MRELQINREKYQFLLLSMVYTLEDTRQNPQIAVISKLVDMSYNGMINRAKFRKIAKTELKMSEANIRQIIKKLIADKHISYVGTTIYINPMYKAVKECEGMFLITPKVK